MSRAGRQVHFLGWVLGFWLMSRAVMLAAPWVMRQPAPSPDAPAPAPIARAVPLPPYRVAGRPADRRVPSSLPAGKRRRPAEPAARLASAIISAPGAALSPALPTLKKGGGAQSDWRATPALAGPTARPAKGPSRWSGAAWLLWRPDGLGSLASAPLLGGSQMGARIDYRLSGAPDRGLGLYGRASRALARPFAEEIALGLAVRPLRAVPVSLLAERRVALGPGGRDGVAMIVAGGLGPRPIAPQVEIEGYAQAGLVGLPGADAFVDGKVSLDYRLRRGAGEPDLAVGLAVSGSAQPGVERLDVGPQMRLRLPVAGRIWGLSAEWRQRIIGDARPASGPAITLVAAF